MRRPDLQSHLVVRAQIDCLHIASRAQIPEVNPVAIFIAEQIFGNDAFLEQRW